MIAAAFVSLGTLMVILSVFQAWKIVAVAGGGLLFALALLYYHKRPEVLIVACIAFSFVFEDVRLAYMMYVATVAYLLIRRLAQHRSVATVDIVTTTWLAILSLGCLTIPRWHDFFMGPQWLMSLAIIPLTLYVIINDEYVTRDGFEWIQSTGIPLIIGVVVVETLTVFALFLLGQNAGITQANLMEARHIYIPGGGSNRLAGVLVFCAVIGYSSVDKWRRSGLRAFWIGPSLVAAFVLSFLFVSRGALVNLFVAFAVYYVGKFLTERKIKIVPVVLALAIVLIVMRPFVEQLVFRMGSVRYSDSTFTRLVMWWKTIQQIKSGMLLGVGPGQQHYGVLTEVLEDPHNILLRYGAEFGGLSIALILLLLLYPFFQFVRGLRKDRSAAVATFLLYGPAYAGILAHSQIDSIIGARSPGPLVWLVWAMFIKSFRGFRAQHTPTAERR